MEEGKLREGRGWLHPWAAGMLCRDPGRRVPARPQGRTSQAALLLGPWGGGVGRIPQTHTSAGFRAHSVQCPTCSTALSSSNPTASTPHSWGSLGSCCAPKVPSALPGWMEKGKACSPIFWVALEVSSLV